MCACLSKRQEQMLWIQTDLRHQAGRSPTCLLLLRLNHDGTPPLTLEADPAGQKEGNEPCYWFVIYAAG